MPNFNMLPPIGPGSQQAQAPQSLLQMAQDAMGQDVAPSAPSGGWAPQWVKDQLPTNLAYWASTQRGPNGEAISGGNPFAGGAGSLAPYYNPDNWGPPPSVGSSGGWGSGGWFPEFNDLGPSSPNEKFWTMKAFANQLPGGAGGMNDESPNTRNPRYAGPGNFMYLGHPISQSKLQYDTHRPISDPATAGSFLPHNMGSQGSGWSTTGELGFPGQLDTFATMWGAGGPGG